MPEAISFCSTILRRDESFRIYSLESLFSRQGASRGNCRPDCSGWYRRRECERLFSHSSQSKFQSRAASNRYCFARQYHRSVIAIWLSRSETYDFFDDRTGVTLVVFLESYRGELLVQGLDIAARFCVLTAGGITVVLGICYSMFLCFVDPSGTADSGVLGFYRCLNSVFYWSRKRPGFSNAAFQ